MNSNGSGRPSGFDPARRNGRDGSRGCGSGSSSSSSGNASPNFIRWNESLDALLNDPIGLDLFQHYLKSEDRDRYHMLKFWLACRGLQKQPKERIADCTKVIYSQLFLKIGQGISSDVGKSVAQQIVNAAKHKTALNASVFDDASRVVYHVMNTVMYPNFMGSETFLSYAESVQAQTTGSTIKNANEDELPKTSSQQPLAVVEEGQELSFDAGSVSRHSSSGSWRRFSRQPPTNYRLHYNSYNPVSVQDSEVQSLSSGGRTDSQSDLTHFADDINSVSDTGKTYIEKRLQHNRQNASRTRRLENAYPMYVNEHVPLPNIFPVKPRTMQPGVLDKMRIQNPDEFIQRLLPKLEKIKKERDTGELVLRKMKSINCDKDEFAGPPQHSFSSSSLNMYNEASSMCLGDDDQDILDKHVQRVWTDLTPKRSPNRRKSPEGKRASSLHGCCSEKLYYPNNSSARVTHGSWGNSGSAVRRKDRVPETYQSLQSVDSGMNTDPAEYAEHISRTSLKQKFQPQYTQLSNSEFALPSYLPSHANRMWAGSQKTITDSGVSVNTKSMTDSIALSQSIKDRMVSSWQQGKKIPASEKSSGVLSCSSSLCSDAGSTSTKRKTKSVMGPSKTKELLPKNDSRPGQPFCNDPSMPPFAYYKLNATDVLEETRRRLKEIPETQREDIHVVYTFSDESTRYLVKVPQGPITLRMFKEFIPRRGNFRYFFERLYEDYDGPLLEEINADDSILPLVKGKVVAQIKIIK